ncbi:peroxisomal biogenesis factor 3-like protein [Apodospora peruviana]|uniref:Peroxisomal biogenesis factor 3-like protein n=1 Tax=Apodospora peruviana TaxID=516989 RepID=A0AAE0HVY0_9PEZI|nr:peroxisomal biogenesis factor 3-like protein [Apodospora peruviana]
MFAATRCWFRRNRTPIAISVGVVGAGYVVTNYILNKLNDARERMSSDRIAKENLRRRFEQNQEDCTYTVLALLPTATTNILEAMNTEKITYEIQQMKGSASARSQKRIGSTSPPSMSETTNATTDDDGRSIISLNIQSESGMHTSHILVPTPLTSTGADTPQEGTQTPPPLKARKTKRQLWDDLTISSITRAYTLLYTLGLLTMLTRIQLNLLGRRSYLSSVVSLATGDTQATISLENNDDDGSPEQAYGSDFEVNRKYLTFSWWLLNRGWVDIMQRVEGAVRQVFGHLSPRDSVTFDTFARLTHDTRRLIEGSSPGMGAVGTRWLPFLLPPADMEEFVLRESGILDVTEATSPVSGTSLRRLLDETADLVESPTFSHVLTQLLDVGFSTLLDKKLTAGAFEQHVPATAGDVTTTMTSATITNRAVLLPKILSVLTRQAHIIGNGMPNEYLQVMEAVRDLEGFAAVVYSSNWQAEIARDEEVAAAAATVSLQRDVVGGKQSQQQSQQLPPAVPVVRSSVLVGESSSLVMVDQQQEQQLQQTAEDGFDSAWERAFEKQHEEEKKKSKAV